MYFWGHVGQISKLYRNYHRCVPKRRLHYIVRFISYLTEKCDLIFRLLKKHDIGVWDEECQKTFEKVKHYLSNARMLMPPHPNKPLIL
ncbi:Integrase, catalytic core [Gossypium australe]|uniref:Integrase, catalytic core n=1 Tax=Gossypium australe TaxID=47621 RepID=A0A5B6WMN6_9ROSI|nr:Integrase, catalytic core [Gossypium australe]